MCVCTHALWGHVGRIVTIALRLRHLYTQRENNRDSWCTLRIDSRCDLGRDVCRIGCSAASDPTVRPADTAFAAGIGCIKHDHRHPTPEKRTTAPAGCA